MKNSVLIFHGTGGYPEENWFPWLKEELAKRGFSVFVPQFPHPKDHPLKYWLEVLDKYKEYINEDSVLIGHSLGGTFLLRVLERLDHPVKAAFLVGSPVGVRPVKFYESDKSFSGFNFDWDNIKKGALEFSVYYSDNDPYVSLGNGEELAKQLGVKLKLIPNAGHFNTASGYLKFERLLKDVNRVLKVN